MKKIFPILFLLSVFHLSASQKVEMIDIPVNDSNCQAGGIRIIVGYDSDGSEHLEGDEIESSAYLCNGKDVSCAIVASVGASSPFYSGPGKECENSSYGVPVTGGVDCDGDGAIDDGKKIVTVLCYGSDGSNGNASVEDGDADDGENGKSGKGSEVVVSDAEKHCASGGSKIETRYDANNNGVFEDSEISVSYVCNGESPQGSQGEQGKQGVAGTDGLDGSNGAKGERGDKGEQGDPGIAGEPGETGPDGFDSLVSIVDEAAGDNCENGGKKFMSGLDKDRNGVLDDSEVKNSYYICNGKNAVEASEQATSSGCSLTIF